MGKCLTSGFNSTTALLAVAAAMATSSPAFAAERDNAQADRPDNTGSEIVVTARRREENLMQAPVVASVLAGSELVKSNIQTVDQLQEIVPSLRIQRGFGGSVGAVVNIRGIGSGTSGTFVDQSVGIAVDQVGFSHGSFYDAAAFDLARVEVLRGPQGLYFGKSTTAGIISLTTANPTKTWQGSVTGGYEFNAREFNLNGFVSGPLTQNLGVRLAGFYDRLSGYLYNPNPAGSAAQFRVPDGHSEGGRLTLDYDGGPLRVNLKGTLTNAYTHGEQQAIRQFASCPTGKPQNSFFQYDNCTLDQNTLGETAFPLYNGSIDWLNSKGDAAAFANYSPLSETPADGSGFLAKKSSLLTAIVDYDVAPQVTVTSVTGLGNVNTRTMQQGYIISLGPYQLFNRWKSEDFSEELRVTSNWKDSPINFMIGGLYASSKNENTLKVVLPSITTFNVTFVTRKVKTKSAFAQLMFTPIAQLEFDAGVRYTHVRQSFPWLSALTNVVGFRPGDANDASINQAPLVPDSEKVFSQHNTSPEFTLTYRPNSDITAFASYKWGYKGPGYNVSAFLSPVFTSPGALAAFGGEKVRGAEAGIKAAVMDRQMDLTLSLYHYKYLGLQVSHYDAVQGRSIISNGADATTKGVEVGMNLHPHSIPGLSVNAFVAYNDAKYDTFTTSPCYGGQTLATGCHPVSTTVSTLVQDLSGKPLQFAPKWTGNLNVAYETPVVDDYRLKLSTTLLSSSRYNYTPANSPNGWQRRWTTVDASIGVASPDDRFEIELIGRNLTNKYYVMTGFDSGAVTPGVLSDLQGIANRSRQIMLQLTVRTGG